MKKWNGLKAAEGCCTCIGQGDCKKWIKEIGKRDCGLDFDCAYAHKEECLGFLKYWDDKNGSIDEWRRNNIPMMKYDADCRSCSTCMGYSHCPAWLHEIKMGHIAAESGHGCTGYANKSQTEALLKWHDDRYGAIEQARQDSRGDKWLKAIRAEFKPKEEALKPFATLEEFDLKIIRLFVEAHRFKFYQLCVSLGMSPKDAKQIIARIK